MYAENRPEARFSCAFPSLLSQGNTEFTFPGLSSLRIFLQLERIELVAAEHGDTRETRVLDSRKKETTRKKETISSLGVATCVAPCSRNGAQLHVDTSILRCSVLHRCSFSYAKLCMQFDYDRFFVFCWKTVRSAFRSIVSGAVG